MPENNGLLHPESAHYAQSATAIRAGGYLVAFNAKVIGGKGVFYQCIAAGEEREGRSLQN
jgi:hypothetical protein